MESDREKRVRERAYQIWQREGEPHGRAAEHWAQAEAELELEHELAADRAAAEAKPAGETPLRSRVAASSPPRTRAPKSAATNLPASGRRRGKAEVP